MQTLDDLDKEGKVISAKTMSQGPDLASLEAKIDQMLKYQRTVRGIAIFRGIISFILFLIFVILPIVGGFYFFKYVQTSGLIDQLSGQYTDFYQTLDSLKNTAGQIGDLSDSTK